LYCEEVGEVKFKSAKPVQYWHAQVEKGI